MEIIISCTQPLDFGLLSITIEDVIIACSHHLLLISNFQMHVDQSIFWAHLQHFLKMCDMVCFHFQCR